MINTREHIIPALKTAIIYGIFGGLWILLSDKLLGILVTDLDTYATIQTYKGWLYILITAVLVFHLVNSYLKEAVKVQDELRISEERSLLALTGAHVGTWDWDIKTGDTVFNNEYTRMLGYKDNAMPPIYESWEALVHPDDKVAVLEKLQDHMDGKTDEFTAEYRLLTADKQWKWILARGKVFLWDDTGAPARALGVHIDLTERRAAEQQLEHAKEAAEAANIAKGQFLANMSHEIRTPLNGVLGMLRLLHDYDLPREGTEYLETAEASGRSLLTILNDVLSLSQMEADSLNICEEALDLPLLAETVQRVFKTQVESSGVDLIFNLEKDIPSTLCGDQSKLRQILFNLVGNALKFTRRGAVQVDISCLPDRRSHEDMLLLISVSDTGIGIPEDHLNRVFEPFTQVDSANDRQFGGAGLGLRIVSRLVPLLGGTLCVDSEVDSGTRIHFTIKAPIITTETLLLQQGTELLIQPKGLKILVVEDEPVNRIMLTRFLEKLDHIPTPAASGAEALELLRAHDYDCILMDIQMPLMDGAEATRTIRNSKSFGDKAQIPIIAITAHAMPEDRNRYLSGGMNGYVAKPMTLEELSDEIARVMTP